MKKDLVKQLHNGAPLLGTMLTLPSPEIAELMAATGFDWLFIDGEHGSFGIRDIHAVIQAVADQAACFVRVPSIDEAPIKQALDAGAAGIIVPQVNSADDARRVTKYCHYPPTGSRGIGIARAHRYGLEFKQYLEHANENVCIVVQAEHRTAVDNIESIVRVPGVNCVLIGPNDLSASYNKLGKFDDPEIVSAIGRIESVCKAANMPLGIFGVDAKSVQPFISRGYNLIVAGIDVLMLGHAAKHLLSELKADGSR